MCPPQNPAMSEGAQPAACSSPWCAPTQSLHEGSPPFARTAPQLWSSAERHALTGPQAFAQVALSMPGTPVGAATQVLSTQRTCVDGVGGGGAVPAPRRSSSASARIT
eukprot:COSAG01_NODE_10032_length_2269_cov_3.519816_1_plen_108_part_00